MREDESSTAGDPLRRIADALERLSPPPLPAADVCGGLFFGWNGTQIIETPVAPQQILPLPRFAGVDQQMAALNRHFTAMARGIGTHDILLWGARGMGKSALLRSFAHHKGVAMVQAGIDDLGSLPALFRLLAGVPRPFLVFVDDLAFTPDDPAIRTLRSLLDGGVAARPENVRLAITSNHRHLLERPASGPTQARHARDAQDDQLALVDRFGLVLGFHAPDQDIYLEMVRRHLDAEGLTFRPEEAIAFALERGGRSGRTAWHFRTEMLARHHIAEG